MLTAIFSLILGLEQRHRRTGEEEHLTFGTDRTFVFLGLLGYGLLLVDPQNKIFYLCGGAAVTVLLSIFYFQKIKYQSNFGMTTVILALLTYLLPLLITTQPHWLTLTFFVSLLVLTELKSSFIALTEKINRVEFLTLGKFIVLAGIVLPLVPDEPLATGLPLSPYRVWLAIVVVSAISYLSYLLRKFVFPQAGPLLTGVLGGLYSSTAATVILSRKSKEDDSRPRQYAAAIILATAMMFLRIFLLLAIFNAAVAWLLSPYFVVLSVVTGLTGYLFYRDRSPGATTMVVLEDRNPLEFKVALVFALLYVVFSFVTHYTIEQFGNGGLNVLSLIVGFTDIDPFLLNLFQGKYAVSNVLIGAATLQAIASNNVLKMAYAVGLAGRQTRKLVVQGFAVIIVATIAAVLLLRGLH